MKMAAEQKARSKGLKQSRERTASHVETYAFEMSISTSITCEALYWVRQPGHAYPTIGRRKTLQRLSSAEGTDTVVMNLVPEAKQTIRNQFWSLKE